MFSVFNENDFSIKSNRWHQPTDEIEAIMGMDAPVQVGDGERVSDQGRVGRGGREGEGEGGGRVTYRERGGRKRLGREGIGVGVRREVGGGA